MLVTLPVPPPAVTRAFGAAPPVLVFCDDEAYALGKLTGLATQDYRLQLCNPFPPELVGRSPIFICLFRHNGEAARQSFSEISALARTRGAPLIIGVEDFSAVFLRDAAKAGVTMVIQLGATGSSLLARRVASLRSRMPGASRSSLGGAAQAGSR